MRILTSGLKARNSPFLQISSLVRFQTPFLTGSAVPKRQACCSVLTSLWLFVVSLRVRHSLSSSHFSPISLEQASTCVDYELRKSDRCERYQGYQDQHRQERAPMERKVGSLGLPNASSVQFPIYLFICFQLILSKFLWCSCGFSCPKLGVGSSWQAERV